MSLFLSISKALQYANKKGQPSALKLPLCTGKLFAMLKVSKNCSLFFFVMQVMQKHQKYFAMTDENGLLLPYFVTVSDPNLCCIFGKLGPA